MAVERRLPQARFNPSARYEQVVAERLRGLGPGALVLDIGGGRRCAIAGLRPSGVRLVAVDSSESELALNRDVDERVLADVCSRIPMNDGSVDMVVSKHVMEHLPDTPAFVRESARVLKPGGWAVHFFPCKFALFALVNRALPRRLAERLLWATVPETAGVERFRPSYQSCLPGSFARLLMRHGFVVELLEVSYYGAHYLSFFFPCYISAAVFEMAAQAAHWKALCAYAVVAARRAA
jgi:ubiquinone/menaquinone biosynthesis C-methylase UbiE